ncbi:MAG: hypothetical protein V3T64_10655, partial [Myxococcota bacterium]
MAPTRWRQRPLTSKLRNKRARTQADVVLDDAYASATPREPEPSTPRAETPRDAERIAAQTEPSELRAALEISRDTTLEQRRQIVEQRKLLQAFESGIQ